MLENIRFKGKTWKYVPRYMIDYDDKDYNFFDSLVDNNIDYEIAKVI